MLFNAPQLLYSPRKIPAAASSVFQDNFNRANENLEASANWTLVDGSAGGAAVVSNQLHWTSGVNGSYTAPSTGSDNHYVQCIWASGLSRNFLITARHVDANNFVGARYNGGQWQLYTRTSGTFNLLGSFVAGVSSTDVLRLEVSGGNARVLINGVERITWTSLGGAFPTGMKPGIRSNIGSEGLDADDWESGPL